MVRYYNERKKNYAWGAYRYANDRYVHYYNKAPSYAKNALIGGGVGLALLAVAALFFLGKKKEESNDPGRSDNGIPLDGGKYCESLGKVMTFNPMFGWICDAAADAGVGAADGIISWWKDQFGGVKFVTDGSVTDQYGQKWTGMGVFPQTGNYSGIGDFLGGFWTGINRQSDTEKTVYSSIWDGANWINNNINPFVALNPFSPGSFLNNLFGSRSTDNATVSGDVNTLAEIVHVDPIVYNTDNPIHVSDPASIPNDAYSISGFNFLRCRDSDGQCWTIDQYHNTGNLPAIIDTTDAIELPRQDPSPTYYNAPCRMGCTSHHYDANGNYQCDSIGCL